MSPGGATILVVDDEPAVLETVRDGLAAHGYQVLTAGGGDEAIRSRRHIRARSRSRWSTSSCQA